MFLVIVTGVIVLVTYLLSIFATAYVLLHYPSLDSLLNRERTAVRWCRDVVCMVIALIGANIEYPTLTIVVYGTVVLSAVVRIINDRLANRD